MTNTEVTAAALGNTYIDHRCIYICQWLKRFVSFDNIKNSVPKAYFFIQTPVIDPLPGLNSFSLG